MNAASAPHNHGDAFAHGQSGQTEEPEVFVGISHLYKGARNIKVLHQDTPGADQIQTCLQEPSTAQSHAQLPPLSYTAYGFDQPALPHFNHKGELLIPPPRQEYGFYSRMERYPVRVCMRFGCGQTLQPDTVGEYCSLCTRPPIGRANSGLGEKGSLIKFKETDPNSEGTGASKTEAGPISLPALPAEAQRQRVVLKIKYPQGYTDRKCNCCSRKLKPTYVGHRCPECILAEWQRPVLKLFSSEEYTTPTSDDSPDMTAGDTLLCPRGDLPSDCLVQSIHDSTEPDSVVGLRSPEQAKLMQAGDPDPLQSWSGWDSDLTDLSDRSDSEEASTSDDDIPMGDQEDLHKPTGLKIRIKLSKTQSYLPRKCLMVDCRIILPSEESFPFKYCITCRRRIRKLRSKNISRPPTPPKMGNASCSTYPLDVRVCSTKKCKHLLKPRSEYKWRACEMCRYRYRKQNYQRRLDHLAQASYEPEDDKRDDVAKDVSGEDQRYPREHYQKILQFRAPPSRYPRYARYLNLLENVKIFTNSFLLAQSLHLMHLLRSSEPSVPPPTAVFAFDGEFSTVALDENLESRTKAAEKEVQKIKEAIESGIGFHFHTSTTHISNDIITRFRCKHEVSLFEVERNITRNEEQGQLTPSAHKMMTGELEIAVLPDYSHRCLSAQRTVVRFRLMG